MIIMGSLIHLLNLAFSLIYYVVVAGILLSMARQFVRARWLRHEIVDVIIRATEAICAPFRRMLRKVGLPLAPIDISPLLAIMCIQLAFRILVSLLLMLPS